MVTLVALDRTCRFAVHFFERVHFTKKQCKAMKGLVQVSSALYSLAAFIMYIPCIYHRAVEVGGRRFWGVLFGEKRGDGKHF